MMNTTTVRLSLWAWNRKPRRKTVSLFTVGAVGLLLSGCSDDSGRRQQKDIARLESQTSDLQRQVTQLRAENQMLLRQQRLAEQQKQMGALQKQVADLQLELLGLRFSKESVESAVLDPVTKAARRVDTKSGMLLVSCQEATPLVDGYKLVLFVGNPSSVNYHGYTLKIKWGKRFDAGTLPSDPAAYRAWEQSLNSKTITSESVLKAGTWNRLDLIITPATAEQLGYIQVAMDTDKVGLPTP